MNCRKIQARLAEYSLGELDPVESRQVQEHLDACPDCAQEAQAMKQDVQRIAATFKGYLAPGRRWVWPSLGVLAACALILVAAFGPIPAHGPIEAMALGESPVGSPTVTGSEDQVVATLTRQTGVKVATTYADGEFLGGACLHLNGKPVTVLLYELDGAKISLFQLDASALRTSGMRETEKEHRRFFYCSHGDCTMVAFCVGAKGFVVSGPLPVKRLISMARGVSTLERL